MRIGWRFRLIPFVVTVLLVALGIALGQWQDRRAHEKLALQAKMAQGALAAPLDLDGAPRDDLAFRRVRVRGQFVPGWTVYLDNRPYNGRAGFYVMMPLRIEGSTMHILVARGWLARDMAQRDRIAPYPTPTGAVTVEGVVKANMGRVMQLGEAAPVTSGAIVQNIDLAQLAKVSGLALQPFVLEQGASDIDTLVRDWPAPNLGVEKHQGYAFQWYALAGMALLFFVFTGFKREPN